MDSALLARTQTKLSCNSNPSPLSKTTNSVNNQIAMTSRSNELRDQILCSRTRTTIPTILTCIIRGPSQHSHPQSLVVVILRQSARLVECSRQLREQTVQVTVTWWGNRTLRVAVLLSIRLICRVFQELTLVWTVARRRYLHLYSRWQIKSVRQPLSSLLTIAACG